MTEILSAEAAQEITQSFFNNMDLRRVIQTLLVIVVACVIRMVAQKFFARWRNSRLEQTFKLTQGTTAGVLLRLINAAYIMLVVFIILELYGVNVRGLLASIGILSAVVGLAMQDLLKDLIMGVRIFTEHTFKVGDIVEYNGQRARVVSFGLKTTELYLLANDGTLYLANRLISEITRFEPSVHCAYLDLPFSYKEDPAKVEELLTSLIPEINGLEGVSKAAYGGLSKFEPSRAMYRMTFCCAPELEKSRMRTVNQMVLHAAHERGFRIPCDLPQPGENS